MIFVVCVESGVRLVFSWQAKIKIEKKNACWVFSLRPAWAQQV